MGFAADVHVNSHVQTSSNTTNTDNRSNHFNSADNRSNQYSSADSSSRGNKSDSSYKQSISDTSNRSKTETTTDLSDRSSRHSQSLTYSDTSNRSKNETTTDLSDRSSSHLQLDKSDNSYLRKRSDNSNRSQSQTYSDASNRSKNESAIDLSNRSLSHLQLDKSDRSTYRASHDNSDKSNVTSALDNSNRSIQHRNSEHSDNSSQKNLFLDSNNRLGQSNNNTHYGISVNGQGSSRNTIIICPDGLKDPLSRITNPNPIYSNDKLQCCITALMELAQVQKLPSDPQSITLQITPKTDDLQLLPQFDKCLDVAKSLECFENQRKYSALKKDLEASLSDNDWLQDEHKRLQKLSIKFLEEKKNLEDRFNAERQGLIRELEEMRNDYKKEVFENHKLKVKIEKLENEK